MLHGYFGHFLDFMCVFFFFFGGFRGNLVILGFPRVFFGSRIIFAFFDVGVSFNQFVIIIIIIIFKDVYESII